MDFFINSYINTKDNLGKAAIGCVQLSQESQDMKVNLRKLKNYQSFDEFSTHPGNTIHAQRQQ